VCVCVHTITYVLFLNSIQFTRKVVA